MQPHYKAEVIWRATTAGATQRSNIYAERNPSDKRRRAVKDAIKTYICTVVYPAAADREPISESQLDAWIEGLRIELERDHAELLLNGTFQYGNAQKFVNLFLKYLWVMDLCAEPPHFPVDSVIQKKIHGFKSLKWTDMNRRQYMEVIETARKEANGKPLAWWELEAYEVTGHGAKA